MKKGEIRNPILVLIFSFITCGIYYMYWVYATSNEVNEGLNEREFNPALEVFLNIICFPYGVYWFYKLGKAQAKLQQRAGISSTDDSVLYLILSICGLYVVSALIYQSKINEVWLK